MDGEAAPDVGFSPQRLRQALTLVLAGSSLWLFVCQIWFDSADAWFGANRLSASTRTAIVVGVSACAVAQVAASVTALRSRRFREVLATAAKLAGPFLVTGFLPVLWHRPLWKDSPLGFFALLGVLAMLLEALLRPCLKEGLARRAAVFEWCRALRPVKRTMRLRRPPWLRHFYVLLLSGAVLFYFVKVARLTLLTHASLQTSDADLAEFDNLFFNALHGHPFRVPASSGDLSNWGGLKTHAEFLMYLLLPLYSLKPGPECLLVIQAGVVALTAVPVYALAARRLGRGGGLVLAMAYLLLPAVQQPNFYDFHFTPVGMLFVAWTLYWLDRVVLASSGSGKKDHVEKAIFVMCFIGALASREDVALGMATAGLIVAVWVAPRAGLLMFTVGFAYFSVMKFWIMPSFGTMWFPEIYQDLIPKGASGLSSVALTLITNPGYVVTKIFQTEKILYVLHLAAPLAFLWMRRPAYWAALLPGIPFTLLATNRAPLYEVSFQYVYHFIPYVFAATILALHDLSNRSRVRMWSALGALTFSVVVSSQQYGALFGQREIKGGFTYKRLVHEQKDTRRLDALTKLARLIPADASVGASKHVGPHVSTRLDLVPIQKTAERHPEFVLLALSAPDADRTAAKKALQSRDYGVVAQAREFLLLERGVNTRKNRHALKELRKSKK